MLTSTDVAELHVLVKTVKQLLRADRFFSPFDPHYKVKKSNKEMDIFNAFAPPHPQMQPDISVAPVISKPFNLPSFLLLPLPSGGGNFPISPGSATRMRF